MSERTITSLAILKVNWDQGRNYIANFVPFVADCLSTMPHREVSLQNLQLAIEENFGLRIPQGALKTILRRAAREGYVVRERRIYVRNDSKVAEFNLSKVRSDALREHEALLQKLRQFCIEHYRLEWSQDEAEAALLAYLQESSTPVLAAAVTGQPISQLDRSVRQTEFLVNAFIRHLFEEDPEGFQFLVTVVKGSMLANVLLYPDLGTVERRFEQVEVYLDTTVLLRALGLAGKSLQAPYRELLDLLYQENAELRCFEHTLQEVRGILDAGAHALTERRYKGFRGETIEYFLSSRYQPSDVEEIIARLDQSLRSLRVQVVPKPAHVNSLTLDESRFETILQDTVQYSNPIALRHDLDSLTAIDRLRAGQPVRTIEECKAIFVTTNVKLVSASKRFFQAGNGASGTVPHCVLDHLLTTLAWLKRPLQAPDLPRKTIIANCYAALNGPDELWRRYLGKIGELQDRGDISEEDYYLLRFSMEARSALTDITLGDPDAFSEGTIDEVLDRARRAARQETETALRGEVRRRQEAEQEAARVDAEAEAKRQFQRDRIRRVAVLGGRLVANVVFGLGIVLLLLAAYMTLPEPFPNLPSQFLHLLAPAILVIFALLTVFNLIFGTTLRVLVRQLQVKISALIERKLSGFLGV